MVHFYLLKYYIKLLNIKNASLEFVSIKNIEKRLERPIIIANSRPTNFGLRAGLF